MKKYQRKDIALCRKRVLIQDGAVHDLPSSAPLRTATLQSVSCSCAVCGVPIDRIAEKESRKCVPESASLPPSRSSPPLSSLARSAMPNEALSWEAGRCSAVHPSPVPPLPSRPPPPPPLKVGESNITKTYINFWAEEQRAQEKEGKHFITYLFMTFKNHENFI